MRIPFWKQTTSFTCDPACLLMAMKYFDPSLDLSRELEFILWRESYGIGIPGCLPQGLAYSALKRGFQATIICPKEALFGIGKIAEAENVEVSMWTSKDLFKKSSALGMGCIDKRLTIDDLSNALKKKIIPLVMVNMQRLHSINSPHWVVVTNVTKQDVIFHDPFVVHGQDTKLSRTQFEHLISDLEELWLFPPRAILIGK